jgi:serine/threonine protein kinase
MKRDSLVSTTLAGRYRIDALLGEGGMGRVYAGEHVLMRKRVAVKVLHRELTSVPEVVARFEREAMAAANIDHSNVAAATDFGKLEDGSVYLVLEYVEGESLRDVIAQGPLAIERAIRIARQIASALGAAHALDIVHRDLKPENVMLVTRAGDNDFVKVLDFGIAKVPMGEPKLAEGKPITRAGMIFGTPEYMAPEQALGQQVDGRADLYSLGVILFEMLAGRRPFSSATGVGILGQQLSKQPPSIAERSAGVVVPPAVEQVVHKLLARDLDDRYEKAADAVTALDGLLGMAAAPGPRLFTQLSGSPTAVLGSTANSGGASNPLGPARPRESIRPGLGAGFGSYADGTLDESESSPAIEPPHQPAGGSVVDQATWPAPPPETNDRSPGAVVIPPPAALPSVGLAPPPPEAVVIPPPAALPPVGVAPPSRLDGKWWGEAVGATRARVRRAWDAGRDWAHRTRPKLVMAASQTRDALERALAASTAFVDRHRGRLPAPLAKIPALAFLGAAGFLVVTGLLGFVIVVAVGSRATAERSRAAARASASAASSVRPSASAAPLAEEIARARVEGAGGLEGLVAKYPSSAAVLLELAQAYLREKRHTDAVGAAQRALSRDPTYNQNTELARTLWHLAQPPESTDAAFTLLAGPMGSKGADIVYDLAVTAGVRKEVKQRADDFLKSPRFAEQASPALKVAVGLRAATYCEKAHGLLSEAQSSGDERALKVLRRYEATTGCGRRGKRDCNPCMRRDTQLREATRAIEQRTKGGGDAK